MLANAVFNSALVILIMIGIGTVIGTFAGVLIQFFNVQPFIATLAMMFLTRGLASILSTTPERLDDESSIRLLAEKYKIIDGPKVNDLTITPGVFMSLVIVSVAFLLLTDTHFGRGV